MAGLLLLLAVVLLHCCCHIYSVSQNLRVKNVFAILCKLYLITFRIFLQLIFINNDNSSAPFFFCGFQIEQRFHVTIDQTKDISEYIEEFLSKLTEESKGLGNHAAEAEEIQMKSIAEFQKVYEVWHTFLNARTGQRRIAFDLLFFLYRSNQNLIPRNL